MLPSALCSHVIGVERSLVASVVGVQLIQCCVCRLEDTGVRNVSCIQKLVAMQQLE